MNLMYVWLRRAAGEDEWKKTHAIYFRNEPGYQKLVERQMRRRKGISPDGRAKIQLRRRQPAAGEAGSAG